MKKTVPPTSEYAAFQAQLAATPYDPGVWQMYIDWLEEHGRLKAACIARIALAQRIKFGPPTPGDFAHDYDQQTLISRFVRSCQRILHPGTARWVLDGGTTDRMRRFRSRCKFETRLGPKSGLWECRVVGPDPREHPLDCPPMDEYRRKTAWRAYPDEWHCVWGDFWDGDGWKPVVRYKRVEQCYTHAKNMSSVHSCVAVVRGPNGFSGARFRNGEHTASHEQGKCKVELPEDAFTDEVI